MPQRHRRRMVLGALFACTAGSTAAQAQEIETSTHEYSAPPEAHGASFRVGAGVGAGSLGGGGRLGLAGEYWLGSTVGLGLQLGFMEANTEVLGGTETTATTIAPTIALRSPAGPGGEYLIASLAAGYAIVDETRHQFCVLGGCAPEPGNSYGGLAMGAGLGVLAHTGEVFEIGPVLRFDTMKDLQGGGAPMDYLLTLNLELGGAWRSHRPQTIGGR